MSTPFRMLAGVGLCVATLGLIPACSKSADRSTAEDATAQDAELRQLLTEIDKSRDPRHTQRMVARVVREPRFVTPLLATLANPAHGMLVAAIRCAAATPANPAPPSYEVASLVGEEPEFPEATGAAHAWTAPDSRARARVEPLLLWHLQHREPACRAAALAALAARQQVPAHAADWLEDPDATVRAAAITACLQLGSPPWPELATALLSLGKAQAERLTFDATAAKQLGATVAASIDWRDHQEVQARLPLLARLTLPDQAIDQLVGTLARDEGPLATSVLTFLAGRATPLRDPQPVVRVATDAYRPARQRLLALHCLESCEAPVVAELQQGMRDMDETMRIAAARVMIRAGSQAGIDTLCAVAESREEGARPALLLLSRLAGASATTPLEELRSRIAALDLRQLRLP